MKHIRKTCLHWPQGDPAMPLSAAQTAAVKEVIQVILSQTGPRKRQLAAIFMDLVDRQEWPQYYEVIPEPRCLKNIQERLEKGRYKEASDVYTDLSLVFWNALFYNEPKSQIAADAESLKNTLVTEWKKRSGLPIPRTSPPPSSAQKVHGGDTGRTEGDTTQTKETKKATTPTSSPPTLSGVQAAASTSKTASLTNAQTPDVDVDVVAEEEGGHEEEGPAHYKTVRDPLSEEIVKQLERTLPSLEGLSDEGWLVGVSPERFIDIVSAIKSYKDVTGNRLAVCLESLPEESSPTLHLSSPDSISLKQIESRTRHKLYARAKDFDRDMARLFEKARRTHEPGSESYGNALILQRLYQAIASSSPPNPPYVSATNFAALRAGPGNVKPLHGPDSEGVPNVTTHRVSTKDRTFVDELHYKGWRHRIADWVHLANPDDPSRPIIGQVFRCWLSDDKKCPHITVSWYYRPEQTFHNSGRVFWQNEVFKTGHFADHPVEDIIEKIACQFTARHIRGRPQPPYWYVGFPLYVCDSRYNDRDRVFVRIKNWNSCVPEEVRQNTEFMPIYPFERIVYPVRMPSPFLVNIGKPSVSAMKWPGGIVAHSGIPEGPVESDLKKRAVAMSASTAALTPRASAAPVAPSCVAPTPLSTHPTFSHLQQQQQQQVHAQVPHRPPGGPDKSIFSASGLTAATASVDKLPPETTKHFDRDPDSNEILWFAAPPLNQPRASGARHSLAYLQFIAGRKRKKDTSDAAEDLVRSKDDIPHPDDYDDDAGLLPFKRARVPPTVTETITRIVYGE